MINYYQPYESLYVVFLFFVYSPSTANFLLSKRHFPNNAPFLSDSTMAFPLFSISPPSPKASTFISRFRVACSPSSAVSFFFFHLLLVERTFIKLILGDPLLLHSERWGCRRTRADTSFRKSFFLLYAHRDSVKKQRKGKKGKYKREGEHHLHYHYCMRLRKSKKVRWGEVWEDCDRENGRKNVVICGY